jgi:hypothetical protein
MTYLVIVEASEEKKNVIDIESRSITHPSPV